MTPLHWQPVSYGLSQKLKYPMAAILFKNHLTAPPLLKRDELFFRTPVDHVAIAFPCRHLFDKAYKCLKNQCSEIISDFHLWPDEVLGCPQVPYSDRKFMASFMFDGTRLVLLLPYSCGDVIDNFCRQAGGAALHHVALTVPDIITASERLKAIPAARAVTPIVRDEQMAQAFFQVGDDPRLVELVQREGSFNGTFTCQNVRQLTEGERVNATGRS